MKKIVVTRMYDFDYFHSFFFEYYLNLDYDLILIFAKKNHFKIIEKSINSKKIILIRLPDYSEPLTFPDEYKQCNFIYQFVLNFYLNNFINEEITFLFADDDEFYPEINPKNIITKSIFFEWYLEKSVECSAKEFLSNINSKNCKGKILTLWNDIYYKEAIIKINPDNIDFFRKCSFSSAFHRVCYNDKVLEIEKDEILVNHLKGIPLKLFKHRILNKTDNIKNVDDWCANHYLLEQKTLTDYDEFYRNLNFFDELKIELNLKKEKFKTEISFFETQIIPFNSFPSKKNIPSNFFKIQI